MFFWCGALLLSANPIDPPDIQLQPRNSNVSLYPKLQQLITEAIAQKKSETVSSRSHKSLKS
jgi:hypothetical protein